MKYKNSKCAFKFDRLAVSAAGTARSAFAGAAILLISGCVSSSQDPVQLGLADTGAALDQPVHAVLSGSDGNSEYIEVSESNAEGENPVQNGNAAVPVPAPRTGQVQTASLTQSASTQTVQSGSATETAQQASAASQVQPAPSATIGTAAAETDPEVQANDPVATEQVAFASTEEPGVAKQGFFQRLFQSSQPRNTTGTAPRRQIGRGDGLVTANVSARPSRQTATTSVSSANTATATNVTSTTISSNSAASSGGALPGVKSNAELFGLNEAEAEDEEIGVQVASVGGFARISPNGLRVQHEKVQVACLKPELVRLINMVERHYGKKPVITSGYRSPKRNRRAGGARNSMHIFCKAADIQVEGVSKWKLADFLRSLPGRGGVGTYCRTRSVHLDTGKRRDWHHPCRKSSLKKRKKA